MSMSSLLLESFPVSKTTQTMQLILSWKPCGDSCSTPSTSRTFRSRINVFNALHSAAYSASVEIKLTLFPRFFVAAITVPSHFSRIPERLPLSFEMNLHYSHQRTYLVGCFSLVSSWHFYFSCDLDIEVPLRQLTCRGIVAHAGKKPEYWSPLTDRAWFASRYTSGSRLCYGILCL